MEVSVETPGGLKRRMTVQIPSERFEQQVEEKLRGVGRNAKISGFRPGKVPLKVLYQRYGERVRHEVLEELLQKTYPEALQQVELKPAGEPHIEIGKHGAGDKVEYTATFEVYPEVTLQGLDQIQVTEPEVEITDPDIDRTIEQMRKQHSTLEQVERAAEEGDQATIDFKGTIDGEAFSGNSGEDVSVEIGSGRFLQQMEDGLKGHGAGDSFTVDVDFPDDYPNEELRSKKAVFEVTVKKVEAPRLPELDDELLRQFGVEEGGEPALRAKVSESLNKERDKAVRNRVKQQVMDALLAANEVETPDALVDQEIERLRQESMQRLPPQQRDPDKAQELLPDNLFEEAAKRRVALGLLISEVIKKEKLELDNARVDKMIEELAAEHERADEVARFYRSNPQVMRGIEAMTMEEQVVERLLEKASVAREAQGFWSLMNPEADEPESEQSA